MAIVGNKDRPTTATSRSLAKDFHRLLKNISGMSGGQARLVSWDESDLKKGIVVSVVPDTGLYKDGEFIFAISCNNKYPTQAPNVNCRTFVYHPNIDAIDSDGDICLNLLDDGYWSSNMTLEDVVQGILFLMHNPNLDDPLCVLFSPEMDAEEFAENVRMSLDGGMVEGYHFERNRVKDILKGHVDELQQPTGGRVDDVMVSSELDGSANKNKNERRKMEGSEGGVGDLVGAGVDFTKS
ncbi:uncharacterized protein [Asterias amurensis]|uniref:uncharacterized protein n=1 Tax=Asterias amurensis TaxID=7602 RepID=UPI003AB1DFEF